jgi:hypothetical protein
MGSKSEDYRRRADDCERLAKQMREASGSRDYEELLYESMARQFREMAEQAEIDEE